eukprot:comp16725_c0_seq1/m.15020 comp16725_c0_seq1/g.15020  ORF comp16725_c0_seq1/g.15020 comp16725_c0_seq1/m.15020 type:complete len:350 (-) comp16725_c0_seq1:570-1619(-)
MAGRRKPMLKVNLGAAPPVAVQPTLEDRVIGNVGTLVLNQADGTEMTCKVEELQFLRDLDKGRVGSVGLVRHPTTGRLMALKKTTLDASEHENVQKELMVLRKSRSDYVVGYYGVFYNEGEIQICMEYMDCGSWDTIYKRGLGPEPVPIPEWILGKISLAVIHGLNYLKAEHNIIHRDIKPSNILLNSRGQIKLCDFNIAGKLQASVAKTYVGTSHYMAPERIQNQQYDIRVDVWSLGLSLVELARARLPFNADKNSLFALVQQIVRDEPPRLTAQEGFSDDCVAFVASCLQKDPTKRPYPRDLLSNPFIERALLETRSLVDWVHETGLLERLNFPRDTCDFITPTPSA